MRIFAFRFCRWLRKVQKLPNRAINVVVYKRMDCHLCETALQMLRKFQHSYRLAIAEKDIGFDPELLREMGEKIPVIYVEGRERFHGRVNEALLRRTLAGERRR